MTLEEKNYQNRIDKLLYEVNKLKKENRELKAKLNYNEENSNYSSIINSNIILENNTDYFSKQKNHSLDEIIHKDFFNKDKSIILVIDYPNGDIVYANTSACKFYGYNQDKIVNMNISQINVLEETDINKYMNSVIIKEENKFYFRHRLSNGETRDVEVVCSPYKINNKVFLFSVIEDITKENNKIRLLNESEKKFKRLFNNISDAIYYFKIDEYGVADKFSETNKVAYTKLGYSRKEILNLTPFDIDIHNKEKMSEIIKKIYNNNITTIETKLLCKDGSHIPVEINTHTFDLEGEKSILAVCRDISKRKDIEKKLMDNIKKQNKVMTFLPDGVFVMQHGEIKFVNQYVINLLGYSFKQELVGRDYLDIIDRDCYENVIEIIKGMKRKKKILFPTEIKLIKKDGSVVYVEGTGVEVPFEHKPAYLIVARDITEKKKAERLKRQIIKKEKEIEEAKRYDELKTQFFSTISHEFKTPLNIILGVIQLLEIKNKINLNNSNHDNLKAIKTMKQNCYRLVRLINNIIDITRLDAGFMKINLENYNIVEVVENITLSVRDYVNSYGINLVFDTEIEEKIIKCDVDMIERIIMNLLSNAIKFTEKGGNIEVNIYDTEDEITISVKDSGIGIPEEKINSIFNRFEQVDSTLKRNQEGSGIGLSLVKSLIEAHNGNITVNSKLNKGSEFIIKLPDDKEDNTIEIKNEIPISSDEKVERIKVEFSDIYS